MESCCRRESHDLRDIQHTIILIIGCAWALSNWNTSPNAPSVDYVYLCICDKTTQHLNSIDLFFLFFFSNFRTVHLVRIMLEFEIFFKSSLILLQQRHENNSYRKCRIHCRSSCRLCLISSSRSSIVLCWTHNLHSFEICLPIYGLSRLSHARWQK